jgi:hypothetical protein
MVYVVMVYVVVKVGSFPPSDQPATRWRINNETATSVSRKALATED